MKRRIYNTAKIRRFLFDSEVRSDPNGHIKKLSKIENAIVISFSFANTSTLLPFMYSLFFVSFQYSIAITLRSHL